MALVLNHPFLLANQVGGNDDLLFDGRSLVAWPDGRAVVDRHGKKGSCSLIYTNLSVFMDSKRLPMPAPARARWCSKPTITVSRSWTPSTN